MIQRVGRRTSDQQVSTPDRSMAIYVTTLAKLFTPLYPDTKRYYLVPLMGVDVVRLGR